MKDQKKEDLIVREIISLHPKAVGLNCLSWLWIITQPGKENEVLESLKKKPEISMNFVELGKYNIRSILSLKHMDDLAPFVDSLEKIPNINDIDVMIWSEIEKMAYPRNLVIEAFPGTSNADTSKTDRSMVEDKTSSTSFVNQKQEKSSPFNNKLSPSMDDIDEAILKILSQNARMPFSTMPNR